MSNKPYSQYARAAAKDHHDIVLKTIDELYADLFQIHAYLHSRIHEYEADETFGDYIPLKAVNQNAQAPGNAQFLDDLFNEWLGEPNTTQLCLLGDFGAGKTTFMRHVHHEYAKKFLSGESVRMPLYIQLRDYFDVRDGNELIERFFSLELATAVPLRIFDQFTRAGRFLLLLDGFDEMGVVSDSESRRRNYLKLNQLIRPGSKVVITCRPAYFVTHAELLDVFGFYQRQMGYIEPPTRGDKKRTSAYSALTTQLQDATLDTKFKELLVAIGRAQKHTAIAELELFDPEQVKAYLLTQREKILQASAGQITDETLFDRIGQVYDLEDLSKRPILLKLIVDTLPRFKRDETSGQYTVPNSKETFADITPSVLYYTYTEDELTREYKKGEVRWQIDRDKRRELIGRLAFRMFEDDVLALDPAVFTAIVSNNFHDTGNKLEQIATDIRTCSFLTLDRNDYLRFAHKSFLEYYVAQYMVNLIATKGSAREILKKRILPDEIFYFLGDLIRSFYPTAIRTMHELSTSGGISRCNALNLLNYAGHPRPIIDELKGCGLTYIKLKIDTLAIEKSSLEFLRFVRSKIADLRIGLTAVGKVLFQGVDADRLITSQATIELFDCARTTVHLQANQSSIKNLQLTDTLLVNSEFTNSTVVLGPSRGSRLNGVRFKSALVMSADHAHINNAKLENVSFHDCIFLYVRFDNEFLRGATFRNCIFIRCYLEDELALHVLNGCRGIFQYAGAHKMKGAAIEDKGRPYLWNAQRAEREVTNLQIASTFPDREKRRLRIVEKLSWEDTLAVAFPQTRVSNFADLTVTDVTTRLEEIKDKKRLLTIGPLAPRSN